MGEVIVKNIPRVVMKDLRTGSTEGGKKALGTMNKLNCWECEHLGWNKCEEPAYCWYFCIAKGCISITQYTPKWCPKNVNKEEQNEPQN